jgi:hypothetical protein
VHLRYLPLTRDGIGSTNGSTSCAELWLLGSARTAEVMRRESDGPSGRPRPSLDIARSRLIRCSKCWARRDSARRSLRSSL